MPYLYVIVLLALSTLLAFATLIADLRASLYRLANNVKQGQRWALGSNYSPSSIVTFRLHLIIDTPDAVNPIIVEERLRGNSAGLTVLIPHIFESQPLPQEFGPTRRLLEVEIGSKVERVDEHFVKVILPTSATQYVKFPVMLKLINALRNELNSESPTRAIDKIALEQNAASEHFLPREQLRGRILITNIYTGILGTLAVMTFSAGTLLLLIQLTGTPSPAWLDLIL
jgi:hypothetical protein